MRRATVCHDKILQVMWAGAKYAVTDKLDVIGGYYHYIQNNFFATGPNVGCSGSAHAQCSGTFDAVSGVIDWRFAPKWDTYIGVMFSQVNGGLANGYLSATTSIPRLGCASASDKLAAGFARSPSAICAKSPFALCMAYGAPPARQSAFITGLDPSIASSPKPIPLIKFI